MAERTRAQLKDKFQTLDKPTEQDFADLIDSFQNKKEEPVFTKGESDSRFIRTVNGQKADVNGNLTLDLSGPKLPAGVAYHTAPGEPVITDSDITETVCELDIAGDIAPVASLSMPFDLAADGMEREDAVVIRYTLKPPVYDLITGSEVPDTQPVPGATIPPGCFLVRPLKITSKTAGTKNGAVMTVNGQKPDPTGNVVAGKTTKAITVKGVGRVGSVVDGMTINAGLDMDGLTSLLFEQRVPHVYQYPGGEITSNPPGGIGEMGSKIPSITVQVQFAQRDAGKMGTPNIWQNGAPLSLDAGNTSATVADVILSAVKQIFTAAIPYDAGPVINDNTGQPTPGNVQAGTITTNQIEFKGVYPWFYGMASTSAISGADVYAANKVIAEIGQEITVNSFGAGTGFLWFAVVAGSKTFTKWYRSELNKGNIGTASDLFNSAAIISVTSTGLDTDYTQDYELYISNYQTGGNALTKLS